MPTKAADMLIARRADTRARADFATWKMLAKLNGFSALPAEAQNFLASYKMLLEKMTDAHASEATIQYPPVTGSGAIPTTGARAMLPDAELTPDARPAKTSPVYEKLGAMGGSNGGLLMGNMLTMRPDLFGAIVCQVPVLDMRRYHLLLAGASWIAEYGDPDRPEEPVGHLQQDSGAVARERVGARRPAVLDLTDPVSFPDGLDPEPACTPASTNASWIDSCT